MNLFTECVKEEVQKKFTWARFSFLETINSTNSYCREQYSHNNTPQIVIANSQEEGRGGYGRSWQSPKSKNIYLSFTMENIFRDNIGALNLYLGTIIYEAIIENFPDLEKDITIKWPNDIYLNDKKIAGLLIENLDNLLQFVLVGVGINVYAEPLEIPGTATSLKQMLPEICLDARKKIICSLITKIKNKTTDDWYEKFTSYSQKTRETSYTYSKSDRKILALLNEVKKDGSIVVEHEGQYIHLRY